MNIQKINATPANRKTLRKHAKEAMADYSPVMTWLLLDKEGDLWILTEPQGQNSYVGSDEVIATTGSFYKAHGSGAARSHNGEKYTSQKDYLTDLLGESEYNRIFGK